MQLRPPQQKILLEMTRDYRLCILQNQKVGGSITQGHTPSHSRHAGILVSI
jgi:hypothetical protein